MSTTIGPQNSQIESIARQAVRDIVSRKRNDFIKQILPSVLWLTPLIPAIALLIQAVRWISGRPADMWFWLIPTVLLTILIPVQWLIVRVLARRFAVSRQQALGTVDETLKSSERIVTADSFLKSDQQTGFMKAAVEDAQDWVDKAARTTVSLSSDQQVSNRAWLAIPLTILLLALAFMLSRQERASAESSGEIDDAKTKTTAVAPPIQNQDPDVKPEDEPKKETPKRREQRKKKTTSRKNVAATTTPDSTAESKGRLSDGESSESQQSSNPSNAEGAPSSEGQPSKAGEPVEKKKKPPKKKKETKQREPKAKKAEEPSGATAGQGSSSGSNNNAAASDWSSRNQQATPDDEDPSDEDDVEDEDEEQESRGGMQPNLRDRRTPVNRDLNVGFGSGRPNPDANGRGGPSGQKKSRGVASLVLGVPIPDRINGQPNKGRTRITQQRVTPEAEDSEKVTAQNRGERSGTAGRVAHPTMEPWLQNFVRDYFLQRRSEPAAGNPNQ